MSEPSHPISVQELVDRFLLHAGRKYDPRPGCPSNETKNVSDACRPWVDGYGSSPAADLTIETLEEIQHAMCRKGYVVSTVNKRMQRIKRVVRWGVKRRTVPATVLGEFELLDPVRAPQAKHKPPVEAVSMELVERTLTAMEGIAENAETACPGSVPCAAAASFAANAATRPLNPLMSNRKTPSPVPTIIRLMLLTGMRPGEAVIMRGTNVSTAGNSIEHGLSNARDAEVSTAMNGKSGQTTWLYKPDSHKNQWRGHTRSIVLGPQAIKLILPFMRDGHLFLTRLGKPYTTNSLLHAVYAACDRAGVERWSPNQLRHRAATLCYERFGIETTQEMLGHKDPRTTEGYVDQLLTHVSEYQRRFG